MKRRRKGFESRSQPLLPRTQFFLRMLMHACLGILIAGISLFVGMYGYHHIEGLSWIDSLLNASMILGGMGPVDVLKTNEAKIFASAYALFAGVIFLGIVGLIFSPLIHRALHKFHLDE